MGNLIPAGTGFDRELKYEFDDKETLLIADSDEDQLEGNFEISLDDDSRADALLSVLQANSES